MYLNVHYMPVTCRFRPIVSRSIIFFCPNYFKPVLLLFDAVVPRLFGIPPFGALYLQIRSMRFVKEIDLLVVVEGTAILKIYSAGLHKVGQIEPAISVRKLMIDNNQRSKKTTAKKGKPQGSGAAARTEASATATKGQEVTAGRECLGTWSNQLLGNRCTFVSSWRCSSVWHTTTNTIPCIHNIL